MVPSQVRPIFGASCVVVIGFAIEEKSTAGELAGIFGVLVGASDPILVDCTSSIRALVGSKVKFAVSVGWVADSDS